MNSKAIIEIKKVGRYSNLIIISYDTVNHFTKMPYTRASAFVKNKMYSPEYHFLGLYTKKDHHGKPYKGIEGLGMVEECINLIKNKFKLV